MADTGQVADSLSPAREDFERQFHAELPPLPLEDDTISLFRWSRPDLWGSGSRESDSNQETLIRHIAERRNAVLEKVNYPCIAGYSYLIPGILYQPCFAEVVQRMSAAKRPDGFEPTFLDLGCGLAQDARALLAFSPPGAIPSSRIVAADLNPTLLEAGFELFGDKAGQGKISDVKWETCDIFRKEDVERLKSLTHQGTGYDVIWLGSFIHLFSLTAQKEVVRALEYLLSPRPGSIMFGRQTGAARARLTGQDYAGDFRPSMSVTAPVDPANAALQHPASKAAAPRAEEPAFRHDGHTFKEMIESCPARSGNASSDGNLRPWTCSVQVTDWSNCRAGKDPVKNLEVAKNASLRRVFRDTKPTTKDAQKGEDTADDQDMEIKSLHFVVVRE
ncbi:unnamed protein product [Parajaminaea phylloscopi]